MGDQHDAAEALAVLLEQTGLAADQGLFYTGLQASVEQVLLVLKQQEFVLPMAMKL